MLRFVPAAVFAATLIWLVGFGSGSDDDRPRNLSDAEVAVLDEIADAVEDEGYMRPVFPVYLPEGLPRTPNIYQRYDDQLSFDFYIEPPDDLTTSTLYFVDVQQYRDPDESIWEGCDEDLEEVECVDVSGARMTLSWIEQGADEVEYSLSFNTCSYRLWVNGAWWRLTEPFSDAQHRAFREEVLRIGESMLDRC